MSNVMFMIWTVVYYGTCIWPIQQELQDNTRLYWNNATNAACRPECPAVITKYLDTMQRDLMPAVLSCNSHARARNGIPVVDCIRVIERMSPVEYEFSFKRDPLYHMRCVLSQTASDELEFPDESYAHCRFIARRLLAN